MLQSKLSEGIICLKAGRVTLPYPFKPCEPNAGFRGRPVLDGEKCLGCGACANVCPPRTIEVKDGQEKRKILFKLESCTYCGRCQDVCPAGAARLTLDFETATDSIADLHQVVELDLAFCENCKKPYSTKRVIVTVGEKITRAFGKGEPGWLRLCPLCRSTLVAAGIREGG